MLRRSCTTFLGSILLCAALAAPSLAQECITGPESSCEPAELCAPDGYAYYYWAPPGGGVQTTRCITASVEGLYSVRFGSSPETLGEPCFFKFHIDCGPGPCEIKGPREVCAGQKAQLCGPDGYTYLWSGPGGYTATTQCITVGPGTYHLIATLGETKLECDATVTEKKEGCTFNCPRTVGFWGQQCSTVLGGNQKFTVAQMNAITGCVDDKAAIFNWGSQDWSKFCATVNAGDMNQRVQAKRQFAAFLANLCTDEQNQIAGNGDEILLDPSTPVTCGGSTTTVGALVASVDAKLVQLEGQNISLNTVKNAYSAIITCLNEINNGRGIGPTCGTTQVLLGAAGMGRDEAMSSSPGMLELARPFPNPTSGLMRMDFVVQGSGSMVKIAVYDLSGRKVRDLVSGVHAAGTYRTEWNARDASNSRVRSGIYFIRGTIGGTSTTRQVIVN